MRAQSDDVEAPSEKTPSLMEIIEAILNDQEFVSLRPQKQLRVLLHIYDILEKHLKAKQKTNQLKRHFSLTKTKSTINKSNLKEPE